LKKNIENFFSTNLVFLIGIIIYIYMGCSFSNDGFRFP
jgi:hypothetical protein